MWQRLTVDRGWPLVVHRLGEGPAIVMLPSLGRPATDLARVGGLLADRGYAVAAIEFRGVGGSGGPLQGLTLDDYAADVAHVVEQGGLAPCHLIGAPFGSRVARLLAARRPELVASVTVIAAGGRVPPDPDTLAKARAFMAGIAVGEDRAKLRDLGREVYFSPSFQADPAWMDAWLAAWSPAALMAQRSALHASGDPAPLPSGRPVLILQGADDRIAPAGNAQLLQAALGTQARLVQYERAGHMLLIERPQDVADAIATFVKDVG